MRIALKFMRPIRSKTGGSLLQNLTKKIWAAVYTLRKGKIRIISVRRARRKEEILYEKEKTG